MDSRDRVTDVSTVVVRARPAVAVGWLFVATLVISASVFFVIDSGGHPAAWVLLVVSVLAGGFFAGQLIPGLVVVHLEADGLRARTFWRRTEVPWDDVRLARVRRVAGDPLLALEVRESSDVGDTHRNRVIGVLLPVGADLDAVHDFLERRLGRPRRLAPPPGFRPHRL